MKVNNIVSNQLQFRGANNEQAQTPQKPKMDEVLDKFETNVKNSADLNDTIQVPRTIFKGYLSFCAGSALMPVAAMIKKKMPKLSGALSMMNAGLILYGTYSFVRPYIITQGNEKNTCKDCVDKKEE